MSTIDTLESLFEESLKDIYSAEKQLTKALPKMAKTVSSQSLREAIETHLQETEGHVDRLEQIAEKMKFKLSGKKCQAMEGLIEEGSEILDSDGDDRLIDAAIIGAAQKVEHYEISAYGTAKALAKKLDLEEVADLLDETLNEESAADEKLTSISEEEILAGYEASSGGESDESEDEEAEPASKRGRSNGARGKRSESRM